MLASTTLGMIKGQRKVCKASIYRKKGDGRHEPNKVNGGCRVSVPVGRTIVFILRA